MGREKGDMGNQGHTLVDYTYSRPPRVSSPVKIVESDETTRTRKMPDLDQVDSL